MGLDILTEKGQESLKEEKRAYEIFLQKNPEFKIVETIKNKSADIDALIIDIKNNAVCAVIETKSRDLTYDKLINNFNNEWLVTFEKIQKGQRLSKAFCVPFYGFLYLKGDDMLATIKICDSDGEFIQQLRIERTKTQKTINGGTIIRANGFINMKEATYFQL